MTAELLNNTYWIDTNNIYYQFSDIHKDANDIKGSIEKSNVFPFNAVTAPSVSSKFNFTIIPIKDKYQIVSHMFTDPYELFDIVFSDKQISITSDNIDKLILTPTLSSY